MCKILFSVKVVHGDKKKSQILNIICCKTCKVGHVVSHKYGN